MTKGKKVFVIFITIAAYSVLGYFREFLFENVNDAMYSINYHPDEQSPKVDVNMRFLFDYTYKQLYFAKWGLTLIVAALNAITGYLFIRVVFANKSLIKSYFLLYLAVSFIAFLSTILGLILNDNTWTYKLSRFLMGIAQSAIPLLIVIFGSYLLRSDEKGN